MASLGVSVTPTTLRKRKVQLASLQRALISRFVTDNTYSVVQCNTTDHSNETVNMLPSYDILGDNVDLTVNPTYLTSDHQRKSLHWFLLLAVPKRVVMPSLSTDSPRPQSLLDVDNGIFLPSSEDKNQLEDDFIYHIAFVLVKFLPFLNKYRKCIPSSIPHGHMQEMKRKSNFIVCDLLQKNENKTDEMIDILSHMHKNYVPHVQRPEYESEDDTDEGRASFTVVKEIVFGGDVLTNERTFCGQLAMANGSSDYDRMEGVIPRPEGLHRQMNLLKASSMFQNKDC